MGESRSSRHGRARAAAVLAFIGLVAACSPVPGEPAPVYMMGAGPTAYQSMASAPIQPAMAPITPAPSPGPSTSSRRPAPDLIPLDNPPAAASSSAGTPVHRVVPRATASRFPPAAPPSVHVRAEPEAAKADPAPAVLPHGAHFSWPLNGRILAGYGAGPDGSRNDGISIAAPRGAPITAIEAGTVAYAGNELRGYGNLILIKHTDGWISAYGHCDELLVKKGDQVHRGSVIAKVGATGNVNEPQLYFELRRGKQPVDPREFLATGRVAMDARVPERRQ
jgi:murein DD-endopeptidase MepM/ murein hydrolase activator NlpD